MAAALDRSPSCVVSFLRDAPDIVLALPVLQDDAQIVGVLGLRCLSRRKAVTMPA